jgi:hypothetical protein
VSSRPKDEELVDVYPDELLQALKVLGDVPSPQYLHEIFSQTIGKEGLPSDFNGKELFSFRRELTLESDRGAALFAAAHLDESLGNLIKAYLVDDDQVAKPIFSGTAFLATFSARIDLAYLLGLIPPIVRRELHLIRKIRNDFAHSTESLEFDSPAMASRIRELTRTTYSTESRKRFIQTVMGIIGVLEGTTRNLTTGRTPRCTPAREVGKMEMSEIQEFLRQFAATMSDNMTPKAPPEEST